MSRHSVRCGDFADEGDPDEEWLVAGFASAEAAQEYARRFVRAQVEDLRPRGRVAGRTGRDVRPLGRIRRNPRLRPGRLGHPLHRPPCRAEAGHRLRRAGALIVKLRFAPSPTGYLHVGNARAALVNWLLARQLGGQVLLRLDDTDTERSKSEYAEALEEDLRWLGLDWDEQFRQSDRMPLYAAAAEKLKASGRLYPCFESEEELPLQARAAAPPEAARRSTTAAR